MDAVDRRILECLRDDARLSMRALAKRIDLSAPAVAERVRRLEESGVITGYAARIDARRTGHPVLAFIDVHMHQHARHAAFTAFARADEAIRECHRVSGSACYILRAAVADQAALDALLERIAAYGNWRTSVVIATISEKA